MATFVEIWKEMNEETLKARVDRIKVKVRLMFSRFEKERELRQKAEDRVAELEAELGRQQNLNARLARELESVKVAGVLTPDHRDVESTRAFLSGLVREIDKCITFLSH